MPFDVRPSAPTRRSRRAFRASELARPAELPRQLAKSRGKRPLLRLRPGKQPGPGEQNRRLPTRMSGGPGETPIHGSMSLEQGQMPPLVGSLDYLAEVAKDWARHRFAIANRSDFTLAPSRFDLHRQGVRRRRVASGSAEAESPLAVAEQTTRPTAWCRGDVTMVLIDAETGTVGYEQEIVEVLAVDGDELLAEAAFVVRAPGLPPCLGRFQPVS